MFSCELYEISHNTFFKKPFGRLLLYKYLSCFQKNVTHIFRLSIYSAWFEDWEQAWAQYFKPLAWSLFSTQSNICDGAFPAKIVNGTLMHERKLQYIRLYIKNSITQIAHYYTFHPLRHAHLRYVKCLFTNIQKK